MDTGGGGRENECQRGGGERGAAMAGVMARERARVVEQEQAKAQKFCPNQGGGGRKKEYVTLETTSIS